MKKVLKAFKEKNITISLRYYGLADLATGWEIKHIIENRNIFETLYTDKKPSGISNYEDYCFFLLARKLSHFSEVVPVLLQDEHKILIEKLTNGADEYTKSIENKEIIKYINSDFKTIFHEDSDIDAKHITVELIAKYWSGISKEVLVFLAENYGILLVDMYSAYEQVFEENPSLFEKVVPLGIQSEIMYCRYDTVLNIFAHILNKRNSSLTLIVNERVNALFQETVTLAKGLNDESIMIEEHKVRHFKEFLEKTKDIRAPEFRIICKEVEEKLNDYVKRNGQEVSHEIPVKKILEQWTKQEHWEIKLMSITHDIRSKAGEMCFDSRLNQHDNKKNVLMDLCSTNISTDNYFTYSHQQKLNILSSVETAAIIGIISEKTMLHDYLNLAGSAIGFIEEKTETIKGTLTHDYDILANMILMIGVNLTASEEVIKPLCYSISMFACGFSEKLLRILYEDLAKGKQYYPSDKATLGELLSTGNEYMTKAFGTDHIKNLMYFMGQVGEKKIGCNYRNSLAHLSNDIENHLSFPFAAKMLWIYTDILNTVFRFYLKRHLEGGTAHDQF